MADVLGGLWRALAGGNPPLLPTLAWVHLGLLLTFADAQECSPGMCERPLSTISSAPASSDTSCYREYETAVVLCKPGFHQLGDRYVAACRAGDWVSDGNCRVDLFSILVSVSASLVAILLFSLAIFALCDCYCWSGGRRHKAKVSKARRKSDPGRAEAGNGMAIGPLPPGNKANDYDNPADEQDSYFSDDDEEILARGNTGPSPKQEAIYENQQF